MKEIGPSDSLSLALAARREILKMTSISKASHVASAMSVVDILASIYSSVCERDQRPAPESVEGADQGGSISETMLEGPPPELLRFELRFADGCKGVPETTQWGLR